MRLQKDREELMASYDFPAQHWQGIRENNPIESTSEPSANEQVVSSLSDTGAILHTWFPYDSILSRKTENDYIDSNIPPSAQVESR